RSRNARAKSAGFSVRPHCFQTVSYALYGQTGGLSERWKMASRPRSAAVFSAGLAATAKERLTPVPKSARLKLVSQVFMKGFPFHCRSQDPPRAFEEPEQKGILETYAAVRVAASRECEWRKPTGCREVIS